MSLLLVAAKTREEAFSQFESHHTHPVDSIHEVSKGFWIVEFKTYMVDGDGITLDYTRLD
jgi:hypothetical protein